ncbi:MAG: DUF1737 domain-containing protein [Clostridia bacterium]|jgi:hypothetical protein|nr:DUF1737 domain-containing protein [Clostridia bacterium]
MNYKVITTNDSQIYFATSELEEKVKAATENGWRPEGGVNIVYVQHSNLFFVSQAMTK